MICSRCDAQGLIYRVRILDLGLELNICDECEACWPVGESIRIEKFKDLTVLLEECGLTYENTKIEDLGYVESDEKERKRTFFNVAKDEIITLIDEAWIIKTSPLTPDSGAYVINMKRVIGTNGETAIKIIVKPRTSEIRTAYPVKL